MRLGDLLLLELARYHLFDLVLQPQRDNGDILGVDGRGRELFAARSWLD